MSDLLWRDVRTFFDPQLMGALPDLWITGTSVDDWQALFDLVRASAGPCGWQWQYAHGNVPAPLPRSAAAVLPRPADAEIAELRVWPAPGVLAIFRLLTPEEIDFDVDLRELQGQEGVDTLCRFLRAVGRALAKPVVMTAEGDYRNPVLGFDPALDRVVLLADPYTR